MGVSRQYLHILLAELAVSRLGLSRRRGRGRIAPWHFRFAGCEEPCSDAGVSATGDNSLYIEDSNKTIFSGTIRVDRFDPGMTARWLSMIGRAKTTLPCRAADNRHIWERFREFNQQRGQAAVPAGYLLGFMRKWRTAALTSTPTVEGGAVISSKKRELQSLIAKAPFENRHFHERDLKLAIGESLYVSRLAELQARFGCSAFQARLALHGRAVAAGVIGR